MKEKYKKLLILLMLLLPKMVFASNVLYNEFPMDFALIMEIFVSIHMSVFVLMPMAKMFAKDNSKSAFWKMFAARAIFLIIVDAFITPAIAIVDFFAVFIGAFIVVPICAAITKTNPVLGNYREFSTPPEDMTTLTNSVKGIELKCAKCNAVLKITDKFCTQCGAPFDGNNVVVTANENSTITPPPKEAIHASSFDKIYSLTEDKCVEEFIERELTKAGIDKSTKLIPNNILKRKKILNAIFALLVFIYISMIFFHFPFLTYFIGFIILIVFFIVTRKYNLMKYLKKELKARPGEKISNIVMTVKNTFAEDNSLGLLLVSLVVAIVSPLIIFSSPRIIYEKTHGGYAVRYYIFGVKNYQTATIPETYKNEKVVTLRGNTFSNMYFLKSVTLPNTITTIRGQAFKNCFNLKEVNIPTNLEYLGGGAFYNAVSIQSIELPDSLTYLGGESFKNAISLKHIKLSNQIPEIRGNTFDHCSSLERIDIPDSVTRIGGHAFYGASSLSEVNISENSQLIEIGSSAFRLCDNLYSIKIPAKTFVNSRAFKESPTNIERYPEVQARWN